MLLGTWAEEQGALVNATLCGFEGYALLVTKQQLRVVIAPHVNVDRQRGSVTSLCFVLLAFLFHRGSLRQVRRVVAAADLASFSGLFFIF